MRQSAPETGVQQNEHFVSSRILQICIKLGKVKALLLVGARPLEMWA